MIKIYTDGSCGGKNRFDLQPENNNSRSIWKPMGIGIYINYKDKIIEYGKYMGYGTNQRAELLAIKESFLKLKNYRFCDILIHTDSKYCIGVLSKNWKAKANIKLITSIYREMEKFKSVHFKWVKGHKGNIANEIADRLATESRLKFNKNVSKDVNIEVSGQIKDNFVYKTKIYTKEEIAEINHRKKLANT